LNDVIDYFKYHTSIEFSVHELEMPVCINILQSPFGVESKHSICFGVQNMSNTVTLPQTLFKRLEKISSGSRLTPQSIIKQAIIDRVEYEEWFAEQVAAGVADEKAGRVYGKEEFWLQLDRARNERKKAA
jgi:predicted transcriptional regulator